MRQYVCISDLKSVSLICLCVHSCSLNKQTKILMNGNSTKSRVSVQIFSLVSLNVIYLHCQVHICVQTGLDTCVTVSASGLKDNLVSLYGGDKSAHCLDSCVSVQDCLQRTARSVNTVGTGYGSSGPLQRSDESEYLYAEQQCSVASTIGSHVL